eukprot:TRINITY_DN6906_c0_g1_i1.p1 TRINITY_DN6906_c0_g1~~TRINITY_DN6906_c0_g1_i1.p1  ORF type:complete len:503 (-),score=102.19 TRINITY_DN6906_c0_g1_i1:250-1758(-)
MEDVFKLVKASGDLEEVTKKMKGKDITAKDKFGQTILHIASGEGRDDIVQYCIKKGVSVTEVDKNGWTPLHCAASAGSLATCETLLLKGASPIAASTDGTTPLHYLARIQWDSELSPKVFCSVLLKNVSDINILNRHGESPLHQASLKGVDDCASFLLANGANPNLSSKQGETPLHFAIRAGKLSCVRVLMEYGADPILKSIDGDAYSLAKSTNMPGLVDAILEGRAKGSVRSDLDKIYKKGYLNRFGGNLVKKWKKTWFALTGKALYCCASEIDSSVSTLPPTSPIIVDTTMLKEIAALTTEEHKDNEFTIAILLQSGNKFLISVEEKTEMYKWMLAIDGLRSRTFSATCMEDTFKTSILQSLYKDGFKGGIIKSSFDEEWMYAGDGQLQCCDGWDGGPIFTWDGKYLKPKTPSSIGFGRFNGFLFEWLDADQVVCLRYWMEDIDREYLCDNQQLTWKWTRHFLALKHSRGEWIVENFVPDPVVFFLSLIRIRRQQQSNSK